MIKIHILAIGTLKKGALYDLYCDYEKRSGWPIKLHECRNNEKLAEKINKDLSLIHI